MTEVQLVLVLFGVFFTLHFLVERALSWLNTQHVLANAGAVPAEVKDKIDAATHARSVEYTLERARFGKLASVYEGVTELFFLFSGLFPFLYFGIESHGPGGLTNGVLLLIAAGVFASLMSLPIQIYSTFVLEARFGFNKTDVRTFIMDRIKGALVGAVIGIPFLYALLWFVRFTGPWWWIWATVFVIGFQLAMVVIYPLLIAPLFNKFQPLGDGDLKAKLESLAQRCNFAARGIFVMDGSKRSAHSNAYFTGFGRARRIVLFDTLIQQLTSDELAGVLAHEIGHYKRGHIPRMLLLGALMTLAGFYVLSLLIDWSPLYHAFDLPGPDAAAGLILFSMLAGHFTFWIGPLFNALSRKHEYEADAYASEHGGGPEPIASALIKLHEKNLSNLTPHPLYSAYHYSHPTLVERIRSLGRIQTNS